MTPSPPLRFSQRLQAFVDGHGNPIKGSVVHYKARRFVALGLVSEPDLADPCGVTIRWQVAPLPGNKRIRHVDRTIEGGVCVWRCSCQHRGPDCSHILAVKITEDWEDPDMEGTRDAWVQELRWWES